MFQWLSIYRWPCMALRRQAYLMTCVFSICYTRHDPWPKRATIPGRAHCLGTPRFYFFGFTHGTIRHVCATREWEGQRFMRSGAHRGYNLCMSLLSGPLLAEFVSYVDEAGHSKDPQRTYLCLAGLVARKEAWKAFDNEWRTACAEEGVTLPFHMADFAALKRQFKGWSEERRIRLLGKLVAAIGCANAIPLVV